jgi:hypothetical protein
VEPWKAWGELAGQAWRHRLDLPGATLLAETQGLEQQGDAWAWVEERVWRLEGGALLLARAARRTDDAQDALTLIGAKTPAELVRRADAAFGRTPGLVELLGRAGIEVGLAPDDLVEGDEIDDWPARPPA